MDNFDFRDHRRPPFLSFKSSGDRKGCIVDDASFGPSSGKESPQYEVVGRAVSPRVIILFFIFVSCGIGGIFMRTAYLQTIKHNEYAERAEQNRSNNITLPASRGVFYDIKGRPLVRNIPTTSVTITASFLPKEKEVRSGVITEIAEIIGKPSEEIENILEDFHPYSRIPVTIAENISHDKVVRIALLEMREKSISLHHGFRREYLQTKETPSFSHLFGYLGQISPEELKKTSSYAPSDRVGKTGLEYIYEERLRGTPGKRRVEVDSRGNKKRIIAETPPVTGENITLTVDSEFQEEVETALQDGLRQFGKTRGTAIVMRPNGAILGMVSLPSFDGNIFARGITKAEYSTLINDTKYPLFHRAISSLVPPGSTFKLAVGAAALAEKIVTPQTSIFSSGGIAVSRWWFPDWKAGGHGATNIKKAIAESVNTYFYYIGGGFDAFKGLGVQRITDYAKQFGFGSATGIDLPGEASGFLPSIQWKNEKKGERWYIGDTYHLAIGQGDVLVTPIQISVMTALFANGGKKITPHLVIQNEAQDESIVFSREIISPIREGMRQAVTLGSARALSFLPAAVAAKTGTAQWHSAKPPHAWITSFAPYEDPEIIVTVFIEEGEEGSRTAAYVARLIYEKYFARFQKTL